MLQAPLSKDRGAMQLGDQSMLFMSVIDGVIDLGSRASNKIRRLRYKMGWYVHIITNECYIHSSECASWVMGKLHAAPSSRSLSHYSLSEAGRQANQFHQQQEIPWRYPTM